MDLGWILDGSWMVLDYMVLKLDESWVHLGWILGGC